MPTYPIGVTKSLQTWQMQRNQVERVLDNATYDAAHPDDTLLLVGPARRDVARPDRTSARTLMALGMFTAFGVQTSVPVQPMMAIGSGRSYFVRGKSQSSWSISRVMINGRNLLRALYHNAVEVNGLNPDLFDDPAAVAGQPRSQFFINLDSELFYIPFGMAVIMRTKSRTLVASCYLELALIGSYGLQIGAGQATIMESVNGFCDRVMPFQTTDIAEVPTVGRNLMDAVLGLAPNMFPTPSYTQTASFGDTGLDNPNVDSL
jgi:hypothetical protein